MKKKSPWRKRLLASLLSLGMVVTSMGMTPQVALADEIRVTADSEGKGLQSVIASASNATTIILETDITEDITISADKEITLDLNGHTLRNTNTGNPKRHTITNMGKLTIVDSSTDGEGTVDNITHAKAALWNEPGATATLKGGTFNRSEENGQTKEDNGGNSYYTIVNHGTMEINDGTKVIQNGHYSSLLENGWYNGNENTGGEDSVLIIKGGTFEGGLNTIKNDDYGELTIEDGTFSNTSQAAILNWNVATIEGGTFTTQGTASSVILNGKIDDEMDQGTLYITGGTFTGGANTNAIATMNSSLTVSSGDIDISGGEFNGDIHLIDIGSKEQDGSFNVSGSETKINGSFINSGKVNAYIEDDAEITGTVKNTGSGSIDITNGKLGSIDSGSTNIIVSDSTVGGVSEVNNITISQKTLSMKVGQTETLTVNTIALKDKVLVCTSSNATAVDAKYEDGKLTVSALAAGKDVKVTISVEGEKYISATCTITVTEADPEQITLASNTLTLTEGETGTIKVASPSNAEGAVWTSSDRSVATVDDTGVVTAVKEGIAVITVEIEGYASATCTVTVNAKPEEEIPTVSLDKTELKLTAGGTGKLTATTTPAGKKVTWTSDNTEVATVSDDGTVTAVGAGSATIKAEIEGGVSASCKIVVAEEAAETPSIKLDQTEMTLYVGEKAALKAVTVPANEKVTWSSSNERVATVDENGIITAGKYTGSAEITATLPSGENAVCKVTVKNYKWSQEEMVLTVGQTGKYSFEPNPTSVEWSSTNTDVAVVDKNGTVTAVGAGSAKICAVINGIKTVRKEVVVTAAAGSVAGVTSEVSIAEELAEAAASKAELGEGVDRVDAEMAIDQALAEIAQSEPASGVAKGLAEAATGVKNELEEGQNAIVYVRTVLTDMQVKAVYKSVGDFEEVVAVPQKLVYDANAFRKVFAADGTMVKDEEKIENSKLSGSAFTIKFPIPSTADKKYAKVEHISEKGTTDVYHCPVKEESGEKYIEVTVKHFSDFVITFEDSIPSSNTNTSNGSSGSKNSVGTYRHVETGKTGEWRQNATGWWFRYSDGSWPAGQWIQLVWNNVSSWYYFNADGYMVSGWHQDGGHWYYLHPYPDGTQGYMYTGWHEIGGKWYYFSTQSGGPLGSMAANTVTPDGYSVGADGAWIQ